MMGSVCYAGEWWRSTDGSGDLENLSSVRQTQGFVLLKLKDTTTIKASLFQIVP